jgi:hypothetical protein
LGDGVGQSVVLHGSQVLVENVFANSDHHFPLEGLLGGLGRGKEKRREREEKGRGREKGRREEEIK